MSQPQRPYGAKTYFEILQEGLVYIEDRKLGKIKSFTTPWQSLNLAGVNGLEWGSMLTIGARPGAGKTMFVSQILKESRILNPAQDFNILEFQFEMGPKQSASRAFASHMAMDYNLILSTTKQLDDFSFKMMKQHAEETKELEKKGIMRLQINKPLTAKDIEKAIHTYYNALGGKPMLISLDHSWLVKKDKEEKERLNTLYNTVEMLVQAKNELPIIVFMISQLNRSIDEPARKMPGSIANYPTSSDIFGGDALMQGSDMVVVLNRPYKSDILTYGPKEYQSEKDDIFTHILKSRNGSDDLNMIFMKADFNKQRIFEVPEPQAANPSGRFVPRRAGGTGRQRNDSSSPNLDL
jgi:replicative DNA helicase